MRSESGTALLALLAFVFNSVYRSHMFILAFVIIYFDMLFLSTCKFSSQMLNLFVFDAAFLITLFLPRTLQVSFILIDIVSKFVCFIFQSNKVSYRHIIKIIKMVAAHCVTFRSFVPFSYMFSYTNDIIWLNTSLVFVRGCSMVFITVVYDTFYVNSSTIEHDLSRAS